MAKHFFFKFMKKNKGFTSYAKGKESLRSIVPLSIYFGEWTIRDRRVKGNEVRDHGEPLSKASLEQIDNFFAVEKSTDDTYFWIFLPSEVYLLEPDNRRIIDGPDDLIDERGSKPKTLNSRIVQQFEKSELPEVFANINANRKYNRKTIIPLIEQELKVAEHLVHNPGKKMIIDHSERFQYMSPLQFETMVFLIFVTNNIYCSTWRGGTQEKYDMRVDLEKPFPPFLKGTSYIQIKRKNLDRSNVDDCFLVHTGQSDFDKKEIGADWLKNKIKESTYLNNWLEKSLAFFRIE